MKRIDATIILQVISEDCGSRITADPEETIHRALGKRNVAMTRGTLHKKLLQLAEAGSLVLVYGNQKKHKRIEALALTHAPTPEPPTPPKPLTLVQLGTPPASANVALVNYYAIAHPGVAQPRVVLNHITEIINEQNVERRVVYTARHSGASPTLLDHAQKRGFTIEELDCLSEEDVNAAMKEDVRAAVHAQASCLLIFARGGLWNDITGAVFFDLDRPLTRPTFSTAVEAKSEPAVAFSAAPARIADVQRFAQGLTNITHEGFLHDVVVSLAHAQAKKNKVSFGMLFDELRGYTQTRIYAPDLEDALALLEERGLVRGSYTPMPDGKIIHYVSLHRGNPLVQETLQHFHQLSHGTAKKLRGGIDTL